MKNLVIVESPAKAKTINKILGKDYVVKASFGHVRDLPQKELGVDVEKGFKPKYVNIEGRSKVLKELKEVASTVDTVYLAPDPDREGEAIAWHLETALRAKNDARKFLRVTYNEITAPAIREAFQHPRQIDGNKVDSQQARRVLDRIVGYQVSPLLWRRIRGASSAGRVQSVALRLVCEREREILNFKPEEYWILGANVRKYVDPKDPFHIRLARINGEKADINAGDKAHAVRADLEGRSLAVSNITEKEISKRPPPAYITSTLQQAGSRFFGFPPARTMKLAQKLYEGVDFGEGPVGLITYMRTDSVAISPVAMQAAREFIGTTFGPEFVPDQPNFYKSRGSAQEAHEAIRPTDPARTPESLAGVLDADEMKVYRIIWQRFVACQMASAKIKQRTVEFEAAPLPGKQNLYLFRASSSDVLFPGYMKVYGWEADEKKEEAASQQKEQTDDEETKLPILAMGEKVELIDWTEERKETQPPPRYSEATLVKALEENGVGRPSTYASIISVIEARRYVEKEKRTLKPTTMGFAVNDFLVKHLPALFDVKFTASMEELLDEIEEGKVKWTGMLEDFYKNFLGWLDAAKGPPADPKVLGRLLDMLGHVKEWATPTKRGKKIYSDEKFVASVREQLQDAEKPISDRQLEALKKLVAQYKSQIPGVEEAIDELGIREEMERHHAAVQPPSPATLRKLELLANVQFGEPRQVGKKVYDDKVFYESLKAQALSGKGLSENQLRVIDRFMIKYAGMIPDFEKVSAELGIEVPVMQGDPNAGPILDLMRGVADWKPPVQRGKRTWDDKEFFQSLDRQFSQKKQLSPKQSAALKKMVRRYSEFVPNYDQQIETLGLLPRKKPKAEKGDEESGE